MGLFFGETLEEKKERYFDENIDRIGLKNLSPEELEQIKDIIYSMNSASVGEFGFHALLQALMEQNWLILKKLESIDKKLERIE